jgi:hypothetical protein
MSHATMQKKIIPALTHIFPRIQDALFIGILIAVTRQGSFLLNGDGDLGRHITIGNYIIRNFKIPTQDIFSHTMTGRQLVPHEWLAQVAFSGAHTLMGLSGVVLLTALLIAATFTCTYQQMLKRNVFRILALVITVLAAYTSSLHWLARPHIFTFLFAAIWTYQLENEKSKVWLFPLLMLVWANTHGAFIAGFVIWGAYALDWLWEYLHQRSTKEAGVRLTIIGATSFAATFINPAGWHLWGTSVGYFGSRFLVDQTIEYQSPNFHSWSTWPFLIMLALYILALGLGGKSRPHESILFAGWTVMSLYSARNIPLFAIITAPYLGTALQAIVEKVPVLQRFDQTISRVESSLTGIFWPVLAVIVLTMMYYFHPNPSDQFDSNKFPAKAVDWLETNPQEGNMFNNFIWGGYILYRMWPEQTVFIDGQTDFYGEALTREYAQVMALDEGWKAVLAKYDVSWVIVQSDKPLVKALQQEMSWVVVYRDDTATILRKP